MGAVGGPGGTDLYDTIAGWGSSWVPVLVVAQTTRKVVLVMRRIEEGLPALEVAHCLP